MFHHASPAHPPFHAIENLQLVLMPVTVNEEES